MGQVNETAQSTKDCISRQAAIDMIRLYREDEAVDLDELESSIAMMPSAQKTQLSTEGTTFDCISRPELDTGLYTDGYNDGYRDGWKDGREALRREIWEDGRDRLD